MTVEPLQRVQNAAARLVLNIGFRDHVTPALKQLHWLPVEHRIKYNLCTLMHQIHTMRAPQYLAHSVQLIAESSRRPGLGSKIPLTTSNVAVELNLVNVASVTLIQLPRIPHLTVLSYILTRSILKLVYSSCILTSWYRPWTICMLCFINSYW